MIMSRRPELNRRPKNARGSGNSSIPTTVYVYSFMAFLLGVAMSSTIFGMYMAQHKMVDISEADVVATHPALSKKKALPSSSFIEGNPDASTSVADAGGPDTSTTMLANQRVLVAIASFNFDQLNSLEESLEGFRDLAETGCIVEVVIHTTEPYSVSLIDLLNTRMYYGLDDAGSFRIKIVLICPDVRLHLVDYHRALFYDHLEKFDLFIYLEDDMRVNPTLVANYLLETEKVKELVGPEDAVNYNIGITRYEYNFPFDIIIDDNTRLQTANATRVYWEHSQGRPIFEKVADEVENPLLSNEYFTMRNNHQGMFLATQDLLRAWKVKKGCEFHIASNRPGLRNKPSQPSEGTQRVWMSSNMLYGRKHCDVKQLLPAKSFGKMNVHHIPNKNYRRVGRKGRMGGYSDNASDALDLENAPVSRAGPSSALVRAIEFHYDMRKKFPFDFKKDGRYVGVEMINEIDPNRRCRGKDNFGARLLQHMTAYRRYVTSGGILTAADMTDYP